MSGLGFGGGGEDKAEKGGPANQQLAILLQATERIFYARNALDLGKQQPKGLELTGPIGQVMVGKIEQHLDRNGARNDIDPVAKMTGNASRFDVERSVCYSE